MNFRDWIAPIQIISYAKLKHFTIVMEIENDIILGKGKKMLPLIKSKQKELKI